MCQRLNALVQRYINRPLSDAYGCLWFELLETDDRHFILLALGLRPDGTVELLDFVLRRDRNWTPLLRRLLDRELRGSRIVLGAHHLGLAEAVNKHLPYAITRLSNRYEVNHLFERINTANADDLVLAVADVYLKAEPDPFISMMQHDSDQPQSLFEGTFAILAIAS